MESPPPIRRPTTSLVWMFLTLAVLCACLVVGAALFHNLFVGELSVGRGSARSAVKLSESPLYFIVMWLFYAALWLFLCLWGWLRIQLWRQRRKHAREFDAQLGEIEAHSSKTGNVLAVILAIPFVLLGVVVLIGMTMEWLR